MRLTAAGRLVLATVVFFVPIGGILGYRGMVVVGLVELLALAVAAITLRSAPALGLERDISPARVEEGTEVRADLVARNGGGIRSVSAIVIDRVGPSEVEVTVAPITAGGEETLSYRLPIDRRGVYEVGPLAVARADPFGLLQVRRELSGTRMVWIHPRTAAVTPLPSGRSRDLEGPTARNAARGGVSFHTLREYVPGDDLRQVHWRSTARMGTLMIREHVDTNHPRTTVVLDVAIRSYRTADDFDEAVRIAASVCLASTRFQFPVRLRTTAGDLLTAQRGDALTVLDRLAAATTSSTAGLNETMRSIDAEHGGTSLVIITGELSPEELTVIAGTRDRFELVTVIRVARAGTPRQPPPEGVVMFTVRDLREFVRAWSQAVRR